jgi:hypothetical protein
MEDENGTVGKLATDMGMISRLSLNRKYDN